MAASMSAVVERFHLRAPSVQAPAHRQAQVAWHQHRGVGRAVVEGIGAKAAARLQKVPKAPGDEHPDPGSAALQHRIGGDGGAVQEQRAVRQQALDVRLERSGGVLQHVEDPAARIRRHRRRLEDVEPVAGVHQHHVGESPADVDRDAPGGCGEGGRVGHAAIPLPATGGPGRNSIAVGVYCIPTRPVPATVLHGGGIRARCRTGSVRRGDACVALMVGTGACRLPGRRMRRPYSESWLHQPEINR